ncbi:MAG: oxidoreductase [Planctomycetaceae bacterium]|nr:oxidoreductase [Planctomycetaceae bacterium]MCB9949512.1 oxidoreductase [Planctomycetaceae bacterium]
MTTATEFSCQLVERSEDGTVQIGPQQRPIKELPAGNVVIRVLASSLNYKDALAASGHPGIARNLPHVPGIDAWGIVEHSDDEQFSVGQQVLMTGHELGVERWGGWSEFIRVPADWVLPLPDGLTGRECMQLGTAGFTAAQCVLALQHHGVTPESGPVVVTGATGGVGTLSIMLLHKLGFHVIAVTGKADQTDWLKARGASEVQDRTLLKKSERPLLSAQFAGGIDTVGGEFLASLIKQIQQRGCVASCGVAGGHELPLTVYPFILRGVTLAGIDSAWCPMPQRKEVWRLLANEWKLSGLDEITQEIPLAEAPHAAQEMLAGRATGRTVIRVSEE